MNNPSKQSVSKNSKTSPDELLGVWINWAGNDAGLGAIWGYGIEFKENGQALHLSWGTEIPKDEEERPFLWERLTPNSIKLYYDDSLEDEYEEITYELSDHIGGYNGQYLKLTEKGKQHFWASPEPLFKQKENDHKKSTSTISKKQKPEKEKQSGIWFQLKKLWS